MERLKQLDVNEYLSVMRPEVEKILREVVAAVNAAGDGRLIRDSEIPVRDVLGRFRAKAYETALQMRLDESEKVFSPGGGNGGKIIQQGM